MAIAFTSSVYLQFTPALSGNSIPATFAARVRERSSGTKAIVNTAAPTNTPPWNNLILFLNQNTATCYTIATAGTDSATNVPVFGRGRPSTLMAVWDSATARRAWANGCASADATTSRTPTSQTQGGINTGRGNPGVPSWNGDAEIYEAAIWTVALNQMECAAISRGDVPMSRVRPGSLIHYWNFGGDAVADIGAQPTTTGVPRYIGSPYGRGNRPLPRHRRYQFADAAVSVAGPLLGAGRLVRGGILLGGRLAA